MLESTPTFGFTRVGQGETLAKNGYAALDGDRTMLDALLRSLHQHTHTGSTERLPDPQYAPVLSATQGDQTAFLPGGQTYFYKYSYVDIWGLETAASPEQMIQTPSGTLRPQAPILEHFPTGGNLNAGRYAYVLTYSDYQGGETTASDPVAITIETDACSGECRIKLDFDEAPIVAPCVNIYRARQGQTRFYLLDKVEGATIYYDDGSRFEDQTKTPPVINTTGGNNRIDIELPEGVPDGVGAWRIYRSQTPGAYTTASLVHHVVEGTEEFSNDLRDTWSDRGSGLGRGMPRTRSSTIGGARALRLEHLHGHLTNEQIPRGARAWDLFLPGALLSRHYSVHDFGMDVRPSRISAYLLDPPKGLAQSWIRFIVMDGSGSVELQATTDAAKHAVRFPLTDQGFVHAHSATRNNAPVVLDATATTGQAVQFSAQGAWLTTQTDPLDAGTYRARIMARLAQGDAITDDIRLRVVRASDSVVLSEVFRTVSNTTFEELAFGDFTVSDGVEVILRADKLGTGGMVSYRFDYLRYEANLDVLQGEITMRVEVGGFLTAHANQGILTGGEVVTDVDATKGQAVHLASQNDRVDFTLPAAPSVVTQGRVRVRTDGGSIIDGLRLQVVRADTQASLSSVEVTPDAATYAWFDFGEFTPPPGVDILMRIQKMTSGAEPYFVDMVETFIDDVIPGGNVQFRMEY